MTKQATPLQVWYFNSPITACQLLNKLDRPGYRNIISSNNMDPDDFVIFAELNRDKYDEILQALTSQFENIEHGRQGDDWIWIHLAEDKIEIDSFYSMNLEVKGKRKHFPTVKQILKDSKDDWILQVFNSPKIDTTR